jgi:hypothetical protein
MDPLMQSITSIGAAPYVRPPPTPPPPYKPRRIYHPTTSLRTMPSYSLVSPRADPATGIVSSGTTRLNELYVTPSRLSRSARTAQQDLEAQPNFRRTHTIVPAGGKVTSRTLLVSRCGSPTWPAMEEFTVSTDLSTGRIFACGGAFYSSPGAEPATTRDWACTSQGAPIPAFRPGITGLAKTRARRCERETRPTVFCSANGFLQSLLQRGWVSCCMGQVRALVATVARIFTPFITPDPHPFSTADGRAFRACLAH